jgi:hypothetical protein
MPLPPVATAADVSPTCEHMRCMQHITQHSTAQPQPNCHTQRSHDHGGVTHVGQHVCESSSLHSFGPCGRVCHPNLVSARCIYSRQTAPPTIHSPHSHSPH